MITSHATGESSTNTLTFNHDSCPRPRAVARLMPAPPHHELGCDAHGTRVTVSDLFGHLPVRVKQRALATQRPDEVEREWDDLSGRLAALLLAFHQPVRLMVADAARGNSKKFVVRGNARALWPPPPTPGSLDLELVLAILTQTRHITPTSIGSWVRLAVQLSGVSVQALLCLRPSPTRAVQFISFGMRPLIAQSEANVLYREVNRLFAASTFGCVDNTAISENMARLRLHGTPDEDINSRRTAKSAYKWPMFYFRIDLTDTGVEAGIANEETLRSDRTLHVVFEALRLMVQQFLDDYHFRPRRCGSKRLRPRTPPQEDYVESKRPRTGKMAATIPSSMAPIKLRPGAELLNSDIRLPSFSNGPVRTSQYFSRDFSTWSRIKSGSATELSRITAGLPRGKGRSSVLKGTSKPSTPNEASRLNGSVKAPEPQQKGRSPEQPPSPLQKLQLRTPKAEEQEPVESQLRSGSVGLPCEVVTWTDPFTNKTMLINSRTGQTIPDQMRLTGMTDIETETRIIAPQPSTRKSWQSRQAQQQGQPTRWIDGLLKEWKNPVFHQPEPPIASVGMAADTGAGSGASIGTGAGAPLSGLAKALGFFGASESVSGMAVSSRLTKAGLLTARLIAQVDCKFLLVKMAAGAKRVTEDGVCDGDDGSLLVLVDQHAADERCRLERLYAELCGDDTQNDCKSDDTRNNSEDDEYPRVPTTALPKPIAFRTASTQEAGLFRQYSAYFASWGCMYEVEGGRRSSSNDDDVMNCDYMDCVATPLSAAIIRITALPTLVFERCRLEPSVAVSMLRAEAWARKDGQHRDRRPRRRGKGGGRSEKEQGRRWPTVIPDSPLGLRDLLASRACRGAVMFNDELSREWAEEMLAELGQCAFPFVCAHGRPVMVPIVRLGGGERDDTVDTKDQEHDGESGERMQLRDGHGGSSLTRSKRLRQGETDDGHSDGPRERLPLTREREKDDYFEANDNCLRSPELDSSIHTEGCECCAFQRERGRTDGSKTWLDSKPYKAPACDRDRHAVEYDQAHEREQNKHPKNPSAMPTPSRFIMAPAIAPAATSMTPNPPTRPPPRDWSHSRYRRNSSVPGPDASFIEAYNAWSISQLMHQGKRQ